MNSSTSTRLDLAFDTVVVSRHFLEAHINASAKRKAAVSSFRADWWNDEESISSDSSGSDEDDEDDEDVTKNKRILEEMEYLTVIPHNGHPEGKKPIRLTIPRRMLTGSLGSLLPYTECSLMEKNPMSRDGILVICGAKRLFRNWYRHGSFRLYEASAFESSTESSPDVLNAVLDCCLLADIEQEPAFANEAIHLANKISVRSGLQFRNHVIKMLYHHSNQNSKIRAWIVDQWTWQYDSDGADSSMIKYEDLPAEFLFDVMKEQARRLGFKAKVGCIASRQMTPSQDADCRLRSTSRPLKTLRNTGYKRVRRFSRSNRRCPV